MAVPAPAHTPRAASARQERRKAATRQRIVDAASELFWTKGYDATSVQEIADRADVAPGTLYLHFTSKADVALVQFQQWSADLLAALEARPTDEPPDVMLASALRSLGDQGYTSGRALRDAEGRPLPSVVMGILYADRSLEIAGRVYQITVETERALAALFERRLGYPVGSLEPQVIAAAFVAAWIVVLTGFATMVAAGVDPPTPDDLALTCFRTYASGMAPLWDGRLGSDRRE
jgi:AcrR family transcriptional regulator